MAVYQDIAARQIWSDPGQQPNPHCERYLLPFPGTVIINETLTLALTEDARYQSACADTSASTDVASGDLPVYGLGDPFEASVVPQMFVLGAMLVIAWSLVIILVITPRTSFVLGSGVGHLGRHQGNSSTIISIGGRPWLQKIAALTVGVSLFIAAVNSFKIIGQQYENGYQDALAVTKEVVNSYEVRIIRVISTTFVWLAQIQTLIRLFPRHREKVIIKWAGFGLIVLDTLFVILNNFWAQDGEGPSSIRPRAYTTAIPVLSYLFELSLELLYAAWVLYYSFVKRRFAFYHKSMRNIAVMALLSYASVLIPVVFFILDIAQSQAASWGDYIRWVGSAAASVVVWEWVERIEALEREERKNGILGREIFDGDDFSKTPSLSLKWPRTRSRKGGNDGSGASNSRRNGSDDTGDSQQTRVGGSTSIQLSNLQSPVAGAAVEPRDGNKQRRSILHSFLPPTTTSPVSRSETGSAASTVYAVVRQPPSSTTTPAQDPTSQAMTEEQPTEIRPSITINAPGPVLASTPRNRSIPFIPAVGNPFKRRRSSPPPEVSRAAVDAAGRPSTARWSDRRSPRNLFRLNRPQLQTADLPIVVIPAQPRGQIWTPPVDSTDTDPLGSSTQDSRSGEAHTPLSLDASLQGNNSTRSPEHGSPLSSGRNATLLSADAQLAAHSDRANSPLSILPRVDEHSEHIEQEEGIATTNNERSGYTTSRDPSGG